MKIRLIYRIPGHYVIGDADVTYGLSSDPVQWSIGEPGTGWFHTWKPGVFSSEMDYQHLELRLWDMLGEL